MRNLPNYDSLGFCVTVVLPWPETTMRETGAEIARIRAKELGYFATSPRMSDAHEIAHQAEMVKLDATLASIKCMFHGDYL